MDKPKIDPAQIAARLLNPKAYEEEEKKRIEAENKKAQKEVPLKKQAQPTIKKYYDVKVEVLLPAILTYRILAEDPVQALELIKGKSPNSVQHKLHGKKDLMARVYDSGSSMIRHVKKMMGV